MEPQALRRWMNQHGYTVDQLTVELELDRSTVYRYLAGTIPIPRAVEVALEALAKR